MDPLPVLPCSSKPPILDYGHADPFRVRLAQWLRRVSVQTWLALLATIIAAVWLWQVRHPWGVERLFPGGFSLDHSISPDGHTIITVGNRWNRAGITGSAPDKPDRVNTAIQLYSLDNGDLLMQLPGHTGRLTHADFSADGKRILSEDDAGEVRLWDTASGSCLTTIMRRGNQPGALACFSPDGSRFLLTEVSYDRAELFDASTGASIRELLPADPMPQKAYWQALFAPNGQCIVTTGRHDDARLHRSSDGAPIANLGVFAIYSAFSPDGKLLAAYLGGEVRVWDTETGAVRRRVQITGPPTSSAPGFGMLSFSPDGNFVLGTLGTTLHVWDLATEQQTAALTIPGPYAGIDFSRDGREVFAFHWQSPIVAWRFPVTQPAPVAAGASTMGIHALSPDGSRMILSQSGQLPEIWKSDLTQRLAVLPDYTGKDLKSLMHLDGARFLSPERLVTVDSDSNVCVWRQRRPEAPWGIVFLPAFWGTGFATTVFLLRLRRDMK